MNCMLWVFYGLPVVHKDSILVSTINGVGLVIEIFYICVYLAYCGHKKNARVSYTNHNNLVWSFYDYLMLMFDLLFVQRNILGFLVLEVIAVLAIVLITLFAIKNEFVKQTFVGVICDIFNIAMYASPSLAIVSLSFYIW